MIQQTIIFSNDLNWPCESTRERLPGSSSLTAISAAADALRRPSRHVGSDQGSLGTHQQTDGEVR